MKTDIHPTYAETTVRVFVRQHVHHALDEGWRAAHRALQRVPPVLHGQAEAGRLRRPRRALQQALRHPQGRRRQEVVAISDDRRARLRGIKLQALVRDHLGRPVDAEPAAFPPGAALVVDGAAWLLIEDDPDRGLGPALAWAVRAGATSVNVLAERATGLLARRAGRLRLPITVWHVEGRDLLPGV